MSKQCYTFRCSSRGTALNGKNVIKTKGYKMTNQFKRNSKLSVIYSALRNEPTTLGELVKLTGSSKNSVRRLVMDLMNMGVESGFTIRVVNPMKSYLNQTEAPMYIEEIIYEIKS